VSKEVECKVYNCPLCELGAERMIEIPIWDHESMSVKMYRLSEDLAKKLGFIREEA